MTASNLAAAGAEPLPAGRAAVTRLALANFRSYDRLRLAVEPSPIVLTGANGAGKTNLLEALSFLAPGRGLRRARLGEVDRKGADAPWAVAATVLGPRGVSDLGTAHEREDGAEDGRRVVRVDGRGERGQAALARELAVFWLTPEMDRIFADGPSGRRRFLDRLVYGFDPEHARRVSVYEHALRERARLLKDGRTADGAWLSVLEDRMAREGIAIAVARADVAARLAHAAGEARFPRADLVLDGTLEAWLTEAPALAVEDRLRAALAAARAEDAAAGGAGMGPHRSDLKVRHMDKDMPADQCSTGEQKALLISIALANARLVALERGAPPLLLLDEVAAHLDEARRRALFEAILSLGAQAWMTGTDAQLFGPLAGAAQFFQVADGAVAPAVGVER